VSRRGQFVSLRFATGRTLARSMRFATGRTLARSMRFATGRTLAFCMCFAVTALAQDMPGQESWSDSKPTIMEITRNGCAFQVRGLSGRWAAYSGSFPEGRQVVGAINPRQPDVVFFQLKKESNFMFAGPRTCFKGEEYWAKDPVEKAYATPENYGFALTSLQIIKENPKIKGTNSPFKSYDLDAKMTAGCFGGGYEMKRGQYAFGFSGCLGFGQGSIESVDPKKIKYKVTGTKVWWGQTALLGYYDFKDMPYSIGLEALLGYAHTPWPEEVVNARITPRNSVAWALLGGWRFYMDEWAFTPKFGFYKWPTNFMFELGLTYRFDFESSDRSKFLEPK
jgi:hypothetical protein